jgi:lysophospholipase L1-like esterase
VKRVFRFIAVLLKWLLLVVLSVEVLSFLAITISNFILYGHAREGSRATYNAYTLFLQNPAVRPTLYNESSQDKSKNKTIWLFGGSTMRGATDHDDRTIASFLAKELNSAHREFRFTVVNFGTNSFNSLLESKYLQKELIENPDKPDFVIFYDGANDAKYFAEHRTPYGHHGYRRVRSLIESYYASWFGLLKPVTAAVYASFTKELWDKIHQVSVPLDENAPLLKEMVDLTEKRYDFVNRLTKCCGAEFLLIWQPMIWVEGCRASDAVRSKEKGIVIDSDRFATVRKNFTCPYKALSERLKAKPYFVSFQKTLCPRTDAAYQPDGVHLRDEGRRIVAKEMSLVVMQRLLK